MAHSGYRNLQGAPTDAQCFLLKLSHSAAQILFNLILILLEAKNSSWSEKKQSALPKVEKIIFFFFFF